MRKLYVPLLNSAIRAENRADYLTLLAKLPVERVFPAPDRAAFFARGGDAVTSLERSLL